MPWGIFALIGRCDCKPRSLHIVLRVNLALAMALALSATSYSQELAHGDVEVRPLDFPHLESMGLEGEAWKLAVPENREKADSRLIKIVFARLKSTAENPGPPLVYLAGGPGDSASGMIASADAVSQFRPFLELGDVIFLDQRGTGRSEPSLVYPVNTPLPKDLLASEKNLREYLLKVATAGGEHFRAQGVDLSGYTMAQNADDLEDIRIALGADKLNLLGFSAGTQLALAAVRRHGESLANVIVCGVEGLHQSRKFPVAMDTQYRKLALLAADDPGVGLSPDEHWDLLVRVMDKLEKEPMSVTVRDPLTGENIELSIGKFFLQMIMRFDIGDRRDMIVFPRLLTSIDQGDPSMLQWFVQRRIGFFRQVSIMMLVMKAASGVSPERKAMIATQAEQSPFGDIGNFPLYDEVGEELGTPDLGESYRAPLVTNVRTLFLTGTLDWNTPPYQAEEIRWGFTNAAHITVRNAGHEQILPRPDIQKAMLEFLQRNDVGDQEYQAPPLRFVPVQGDNPQPTHPAVGG